MLSKIAGFEVRYQLFSPMFIAVFTLFFLAVFGMVSVSGSELLGTAAHINSPISIGIWMVLTSTLGGFIPAVFLSSGILRDRHFKTEGIFFTSPVKRTDFVLGRFTGGLIATALCFASVPLAILTASSMPSMDQAMLGPNNLGPYVYYYVVLGLVNMWVMGTILFTVANLSRSMMAVWVAFLALLILFLVSKAMARSVMDLRETVALLDPFGATAHREATRYWTTAEQNIGVAPLEGLFLLNRLFWFGVGLLFLVFNVLTFRFRKSGSSKASRGKKPKTAVKSSSAITDIKVLRVTPSSGPATTWQQFVARLVFEVKGVVFNFAFWVILVLGLIVTIPGFFFGNGLADTANYPVTRVMINLVVEAFSWVPMVVVIFYAAELIWRERRVGFSGIVDATPAPSWVFVSAKFLAMCVVIIALAIVALIASMLSQSAMDYSNFEPGQYIIRGLLELVIPYVLLAALAIFLQVVVNDRWLGMGAMLVFVVAAAAMPMIGLDHGLYRFGYVPPAPWSDMSGYGHFLQPTIWFSLYWSFWSLLLMAVSYQLWSRGALTPIWSRLKGLMRQTTPAVSVMMTVAVFGAGVSGSWIFYNTNVLNSYVSATDIRGFQAEYERRYNHLVDWPSPQIADASYDIDIYPEDRRYQARGSYRLENRTDAPMETIWISYGAGTQVRSQILEGASLATSDARMRIFSFQLDSPMQPGDSRNFEFEIARLNPGFRNSNNATSVNWNGTFFNNRESMPILGVDTGAFLSNPQHRREESLEPLPRTHDLYDQMRWTQNAFAGSHSVNFRSVVSTSLGQTAVAPGYLEREWVEGDRAYFEYVMDRPILNFYAWMSGDYQLAERTVDGVDLQVFYNAEHAWNVERMLDASEDSIAHFSEQFGPYQHQQYRILEFPEYLGVFAQSFPNTVPFSEGIGFIANLVEPEGVDYVYMVTAHEAAHQWWAHQLTPANVQGAQMLSETLSEYSALMMVRREYGDAHMRRYLKRELDAYLAGRGSETIAELPLYRVESQDYIHYRKGAMIMYALQDYLGEETVNHVLARLIEERAYSSNPFATTLDFMRILLEETGPEHERMINDFFVRIVLFDLQVTDARATERDDGRWDVVIDIEAHKFEANAEGEQLEVSIDYLVDIGVFDTDLNEVSEGEDHVLHLEKHRINDTIMRFELIVDEEPLYVGIDPYHKLIDRDSGDNLARVTVN
jgi:ABC-2 type transport system permease protein